ncbi:hypothetical protein GCM10007276_11710 [Agaricicola taiwanensis]|uniref:Uncharacterized protein n=1 Tax=Agaricicola taiwanensis TaxID=591372 RepID=A0A8J2VPC9_9RHOB|nr:hypothetical protein [Agaricicola taiwanensis]GGE35917.1 hypothetical protein GCM10007276_11710 [Agaricicola taiwanensis]
MQSVLPSQPSNALYASIVGTVAATLDRRLTVSEIAERLHQEPRVVGSCIALHRYMRGKADGPITDVVLAFPVTDELSVPGENDEIDEASLGL